MRALALLTVRNEGAFLLEWLAHHRAVGFTDFLVFSNDCEDGTDRMLDRLAKMGWLTHLPNPGPYDKGGIQFTAMKTAARHPLLDAADWVLASDIDEFVNIHTGDGTLHALLEALPEATAITLTWRLFGNNDVVRFEDAPVTDSFTKAAPAILHWPWRAAMFKTLYRNNGIYRKPGIHRPRDLDEARLSEARWFDGEGRALGEPFLKRQIFSPYGRSNYGLVQLNHYPLGAMESYVLKAARGRAVHSDDLLGLDYWVERNLNQETDTSISRYREARDALVAEMKADETLRNLHDEAVSWRRKQFDALMLEEPFRALFGRLLMTPPSRIVARQGAQYLMGFANKARQASGNS